MKHLSLLIGVVLAISWVIPVEALRYPPGVSGGGYVAVNLLGPTEVQSGDNFTYSIILTNDSGSFARDVQVTYAIPDGLKWLDRFGHPSCQQNLNAIICTIPLMQPGSQSIPLRFTTDRLIYTNSTFCPRTISSSARVSTGSYDSFSGDNKSPTLSTRITCFDPPTRSYRQGVDLQLNLTTHRSITVGDSLNISAVVTNAGTDHAMFVTVLMSFPSGLSIHDLPRFCQVTGSMITCTNFTLRSGESRVLTFTVPIHSSYSCPSSLEWRAQVFSGSQTSYNIYRNALSHTSVSCRPEPSISPSASAPPSVPSAESSLNPSPSGNTTGNHTSEWMSGTSWGTYNGTYSDPLHVCDLALDVIYPCPTKRLGGLAGGATGGTDGGFGGSRGSTAGGTVGGGIGGATGGGGIFDGGVGWGTSGDGRGGKRTLEDKETKQKDDLPQKKSTDTVSTAIRAWPRILPPDNSGNWVWNGNMWVYVGQESTVAVMDTDQWTLQYCTGQEHGTITYEIQVTNQFETPIANADVVEMLNPTAVCIKNAAGGLIGPRHILWKILALAPHTTQTIRYTVGILPHVPDQFIVANLTHAGTSGPHILTRDFEMVEVSRRSHFPSP